MRTAILAVLVLAASAMAGEKYLGTIVATTVKSNDTTAAPFYVPPSAKLTIQCDAAAYILTDTNSALTTSNGLKVSADEKLPTSTGPNIKVTWDAGSSVYGSAVVQALSVAGTANCKVFERLGTE